MGIKDRIKFIARSYFSSLLDGQEPRRPRPEADPDIKFDATPDATLDQEDAEFKNMSDDDFEKQWAAFEEEQRRYKAQQARAGGQETGPRRTSERTLEQCYQNLECKFGSPLDVVRASYRRLMKKHHPDLQPKDTRSQEAALRITQIITESYQQIERHLEGQGKR